MADRQKILDVIADYAWANDAKDEDTVKAVFADDARFGLTIAGVDEPIGPFEGRQAIVDFIYPTIKAQTDQRRHVIPNVRFMSETDDSASVRCYLVLIVIDNGALEVKSTGVYEIDFGVERGEWKITSMDLALDLPF
jgi:3-phenylpropionate/cinnamic acid dioxygenase small subunit